MKMQHLTLMAVAGGFGFAGVAEATSVTLDTYGKTTIVNSGPLSSTFGGSTSAPEFDNAEMTAIHSALHADGIATDGMITFLLADTAEGLSFIALLDDPTQTTPGPETTTVGMHTSAPDAMGYRINDAWQDMQDIESSGGTTTAEGTFFWNHNRGGDGFAWTNLGEGDAVTFDFTEIEGDGLAEGPFQFVTWGDSAWEIAMSDFWRQGENGGQYGFALAVVPLPAPLLLGLAGLGGVAVARRRRLA